MLRSGRWLIRDRGALLLAAPDPLPPWFAHQPFNGAARHRKSLAIQLSPDFIGIIDGPAGFPDPLNLSA
jgi:hypothetical protein